MTIVKPAGDLRERYPSEIRNFEVWFAARQKAVATAHSEAEISDAVEMVRPYAEASWCFPSRLTDIEKLARKRRGELIGQRVTGDRE